MTYAFASTTKAMTAIRTFLAVMVFLATSVSAVQIDIVNVFTGRLLGFRCV